MLAFLTHEEEISTRQQDDGLKSEVVLKAVHPDHEDLGVDVETGKVR